MSEAVQFKTEADMQLRLLHRFQTMKLALTYAGTLKRAYISYPYTRDPEGCSIEVVKLVEQLLGATEGVYPFVPHFAFDMLFNLPAGYTHEEIGLWEAKEIALSDLLVYESSEKGISAGVRWEKVIAEMLGKPVMTFDECMVKFAKRVRRR